MPAQPRAQAAATSVLRVRPRYRTCRARQTHLHTTHLLSRHPTAKRPSQVLRPFSGSRPRTSIKTDHPQTQTMTLSSYSRTISKRLLGLEKVPVERYASVDTDPRG